MNNKTRKLIYEKYKGKCAYCGEKLKKSWHIDHITPKNSGGSDHIENLNPACASCNMKKSWMNIEEFRNYIKTRAEKFMKYNSDYRLCNRYELLPAKINKEIKFYFERIGE